MLYTEAKCKRTVSFCFFRGANNIFVLYSTLLHLPPLRFHCVDGCWDRTQYLYDCACSDIMHVGVVDPDTEKIIPDPDSSGYE